MYNTRTAVIPFKDVPKKALFRVLKSEKHFWGGEREVSNDGIYVKVQDSHSINIATHADAIFTPNIPCRLVARNVDTSHLPDWDIVNQGSPKQ